MKEENIEVTVSDAVKRLAFLERSLSEYFERMCDIENKLFFQERKDQKLNEIPKMTLEMCEDW